MNLTRLPAKSITVVFFAVFFFSTCPGLTEAATTDQKPEIDKAIRAIDVATSSKLNELNKTIEVRIDELEERVNEQISSSSDAQTKLLESSVGQLKELFSLKEQNLDNHWASLGIYLNFIAILIAIAGIGAPMFFTSKMRQEYKEALERAYKAASSAETQASATDHYARQAESMIEKARPLLDSLKALIAKTETDIEELKSGLDPNIFNTELGMAFSKFDVDAKKKLDLITEKVSFLENFGVKLNPSSYLAKGIDLFRDEKYTIALEAFQKAIDLDPNSYAAWSNKGAVLSRLKRHEEALPACEKAIKLKPDNAAAWRNKGYVLDELKRHEEALAACEKAIELNPNETESWTTKCAALAKMNRNEEALAACERAIELHSDNEVAWRNKGAILDDLNRREEALEATEKALELQPNDANTLINLGTILGEMGRHEEALEATKKALELQPENETCWNNKGVYLSNLKRLEEALAALEKTIELQPNYAQGWFNMACCHSLLSHKQRALEAIEKAISLNQKYKLDFKRDSDFKKYWDDPDFLALTSE